MKFYKISFNIAYILSIMCYICYITYIRVVAYTEVKRRETFKPMLPSSNNDINK